MSNIKHTPGPWVVDIKSFGVEPEEVIIGVKTETDIPSYYQRICDSILPSDDEQYIKEHAEIKANMTLIAAAPEMLEAIQQLIEVFEPYTKEHTKLAYKVYALINKATGDDSNT